MSERLRHRILPTTADAGLLAWGATPAELFENAARGLARVIADPRGVRPVEERTVRAEGSDLAALLAAWLAEWVFLFDTEGFLGSEFTVPRVGAGRVEGTGRGERYDPARHRLRYPVKAVTYHRLEVRERGGRLRARVIFDL